MDFDACAAEVFKFFKQIALGGGGQIVAHRMGDDRQPARAVDGGDAVFQRRPFVSDGAGFAVAQVFGERLLLVFDMSRPDEELGDVGAADHFFVCRQRERAVVCAADAFLFELGGDGFEAFQTALPHLRQQVLQVFVPFVEIQTDNVYGASAPSDGDFHAVNQAQIEPVGFGTRFGDAAGVVVVGQRQQRAAVLMREADDFGGGKHTVGNGGMAVQVYHGVLYVW
ncbi:Uncharacterised protein [Neisseria meningitidis]|nr:Uncharacterised protein [Neisseria meningitidis]CWP62827.1 Uncharacterised protein [Neisseria meningitidis]CWQ69933.1 Uncharacterised protein [Neisseria meningitidis]CWS46950.1 Uncharacterised protein [Neisseria meningitidis]